LPPSTHDPHSPLEAAEARVGTSLNAKWRLDALLGVGGMGAVYAATNRNGSRAALKVLHIEFARETSIRDRFLKEGRIANSIEHDARVVVLDDDLSDLGEPFLVMELLEGETLNQRLKHNDGKLGVEETLGIFDVVLDLLARCHAASIVHRDIKPANVFITHDGKVKVLDFGVARMREQGGADATRDGTALGTPSYMAPEQALGLGDMVDGRADLWSVGACIYTSLSGVRLHQARTEAEAFVMAATQAAPSVARVAPDLTPEVVAFVDKALAFDRGRRFQDAMAMRAELVTLVAALRAGQLAPTAPKRGVKLRGTAVEQVELDPAAAEASIERMLSIGKHLSHAMNGARQYGFGHTHTTRCIGQLFEDVVGAISKINVYWEVTPGGFVHEGRTVWQPDRAPFDRVPFQLFADGIRRIAIRPGLDEAELRDFVAILMRDSSGFGAEDDTVTALWDRRFEHITYLAVDAFSVGVDGEDETFEDRCDEVAAAARAAAKLDRDDELSLEGQAMGLSLQDALAQAGAAAAALAVDGLTKATLGTQLVLDAERWSERYLEAFAEAYADAAQVGDVKDLDDALREWVGDQLALHDLPPAFKMLSTLREAFESLGLGERGKRLEPLVARVMFPSETLRTLLSELAAEARATDPSSRKAYDPAVATGLARALLIAGRDDGLVATVCQCLDAFQGELGTVVFDYAKRWATGHEAELGQVVARSEPSAALPILRLLAELGTPAAQKGLEQGLSSPHVDVRLEAIAKLPVETDERILGELVRLLEDPTASVRAEALRFCGRAKVKAAGPVLVKHVQSPLFHAKSQEERRQWLDAIAGLNARRAEALAVEFLTKVQLIPSEAIEETRVVAADLLSTMPSQEGLRATQDAMKKRWWNTTPVREAAARASAVIAAKLSGAEGAAPKGEP
jgi:serine/threonine protein kinase